MSATLPNADVVVVGGGVIGLSITYELAAGGLSVTLLERGELGREASWAGGGILPPASWYVDHPAMDALAIDAAVSHAELSARLLEETGIDDEYVRCGARYLETPENSDYLAGVFDRWQRLGIDLVSRDGVTEVPGEAQVRNPRRLRALAAACARKGVRLLTTTEVVGFDVQRGGAVAAVQTRSGEIACGAVCLCAGAWTPCLTQRLPDPMPGKPVRGQMLLLRPVTPLERIVHRYPHYAVPRRDGLVLVGATVEDAGFDRGTTEAGREKLIQAARLIDPRLADAELLRHWAGLRPASADALPQIGRLPGTTNAYVAAGHHRSGLQLAPPTARIAAAMIRGVSCDLPTAPFDPARFIGAAVA